MPINCSPVSLSPSSHSLRSSSHRSHSSLDRDDAPRTCECLTQTLSCHGCGAQVGYMIVVPCTRCTSSVFPPQPGSHSSHAGVYHDHLSLLYALFMPSPFISIFIYALLSWLTAHSSPSPPFPQHVPQMVIVLSFTPQKSSRRNVFMSKTSLV